MLAADRHPRLLKLLGLATAVVGLALPPTTATAGKFKVVYSFCAQPGCTDGSIPQAPLAIDAAGNFFGTTAQLGSKEFGTAYEFQNVGGGKYKFKVLFSFARSPNPGALVIDTAGNLYGEYRDGGFFEASNGFGNHHNRWQVFDLDRNCAQVCGISPVGGLTYAGQSSGALYDGASPLFGTEAAGGVNGGGTVFTLTRANGQWTETTLYNFCLQGGDKCLDGKGPEGVLVGSSGILFGSTVLGGNSGAGAVFQLSQSAGSWSETVLYSFCSLQSCADGDAPNGGLVQDATGALYGTSLGGGRACKQNKGYGCGVVFKVVPNGANSQESVLYAFCSRKDCRDGYLPQAGVVIDASGRIFGSTYFGGGNDNDANGLGGGVAYELSDSYTVLHAFCAQPSCADGEYPWAAPIIGPQNQLWGTTSLGGPFGSGTQGGTVFSISP